MAEKHKMDPKGFAALLLATPKKPMMGEKKPKMDGEHEEPDGDETPEVACAQELINAIHDKDAKAVAEAIEACVRLATSKHEMDEEAGAPAESGMDETQAGR